MKKAKIEADTKVYNTALETKDITLCEAITDASTKARCRDLILVAEALEK
jgi:hypothetical protein